MTNFNARAWNDYEPPSVLTPILQVMDLFLFNFLYESVASLQVMYTVLTVEPTEYLEYKIKDAINFL